MNEERESDHYTLFGRTLCPEAYPTPTCIASKRRPQGLQETTDIHPNLFPPAQGCEKSGGCSLLCLFIPLVFFGFFFFSAFQETIIIQIIAVIYSAIRAARCGGRGAETD